MGLINRTVRIVRSKLNSILDRAEDYEYADMKEEDMNPKEKVDRCVEACTKEKI